MVPLEFGVNFFVVELACRFLPRMQSSSSPSQSFPLLPSSILLFPLLLHPFLSRQPPWNRSSEFDIWTQFVTSDYMRALELDALNNSHPIEVPVGHPSEVDEIFDAISYSKVRLMWYSTTNTSSLIHFIFFFHSASSSFSFT